MIRVIAIYRWVEGATFDHEYYRSQHMKLTRELLVSKALVRLESDRFVTGQPPLPGTIIAATHACFPSMEAAKDAVAATGAALTADLRNYTNIRPELSFAVVESYC